MSETTAAAAVITEPGVYELPEDVYHADPVPAGSLSVSGAKKLLPPSCPAIFRYQQQHPPAPKDVFDFGSAAHRLVLGVGPDIAGVDAPDWRTKEAKAQRDEIRSRGCIPVLLGDLAVIEEMALAIHAHPLASALLKADGGTPEASMFWQDQQTGTWLRARADWLPNARDGRLILSDYKTCATADPNGFAKAAANFNYHMQAAWYLDGIRALGLCDEPAFVFIAQEKTAPYLVTVVELDYEALEAGRQKNREAIDLYDACVKADTWPGYADDVVLVSLPRWAA